MELEIEFTHDGQTYFAYSDGKGKNGYYLKKDGIDKIKLMPGDMLANDVKAHAINVINAERRAKYMVENFKCSVHDKPIFNVKIAPFGTTIQYDKCCDEFNKIVQAEFAKLQ